jgi:hypothetical protein
MAWASIRIEGTDDELSEEEMWPDGKPATLDAAADLARLQADGLQEWNLLGEFLVTITVYDDDGTQVGTAEGTVRR